MHEVLAELESEMAGVLWRLKANQTRFTPLEPAGQWTIRQIVEHLCLSYRSTVGVLQSRIDKGTPTRSEPVLRQRIAHVTLITCGYFPKGRKAPEAVMPGQMSLPDDGAALTRCFNEQILLLDEVAAKAELLFGEVACASHGTLGPLTVPQWRRFHLIHGRHHMKQIRRLVAEQMD